MYNMDMMDMKTIKMHLIGIILIVVLNGYFTNGLLEKMADKTDVGQVKLTSGVFIEFNKMYETQLSNLSDVNLNDGSLENEFLIVNNCIQNHLRMSYNKKTIAITIIILLEDFLATLYFYTMAKDLEKENYAGKDVKKAVEIAIYLGKFAENSDHEGIMKVLERHLRQYINNNEGNVLNRRLNRTENEDKRNSIYPLLIDQDEVDQLLSPIQHRLGRKFTELKKNLKEFKGDIRKHLCQMEFIKNGGKSTDVSVYEGYPGDYLYTFFAGILYGNEIFDNEVEDVKVNLNSEFLTKALKIMSSPQNAYKAKISEILNCIEEHIASALKIRYDKPDPNASIKFDYVVNYKNTPILLKLVLSDDNESTEEQPDAESSYT